jgi:hypothetical protein
MAVLRKSLGRLEWHYIVPGKPMQNAFIESFTIIVAHIRALEHYAGPVRAAQGTNLDTAPCGGK